MAGRYTLLDVTIGHVIHKLVKHFSTEGGSEQEVNLSFKFYSIKVCNLCYLVMGLQGSKSSQLLHGRDFLF